MSKPTLYLGHADQGTPLSRAEFAEAQYEEHVALRACRGEAGRPDTVGP